MVNFTSANHNISKIRLFNWPILIDKAMIAGNQHIGGISCGKFFYYFYKFLQGLFHSLKNPFLRFFFIACCIYPVMKDIDNIMLTKKAAALISIKSHKFIRPHRLCTSRNSIGKDLGPVGSTLGTNAVNHDSCGLVGEGYIFIGQQGSHAQLGIAREHRKHWFNLCLVTVFPAYQTKKLVTNFKS